MSALSRWFWSGFTKSRSSGISSRPSTSDQSLNRVLHGRVTKPTHTEATSSKDIKYRGFIPYNEDNEKDEDVTFKSSLDATTFAAQADESDGERNGKEESDYVYNNGDDKGKLAIGLPLAMMVQPTEESEEFDSEDNVEDETDSESNPDTAWRLEQIYLNTILNARNEYTLMPSTWRMHFRGIPLPNSLFYIKTKSKSIRPRIYARTDRLEYRGALALRKLIDVHARIQDIRGDEAEAKGDQEMDRTEKKALIRTISAHMVKQLRRALEQALDWAKQDGGIDQYGDTLPPNVMVMELKDISVTDEPESELKIQLEMCELAQQWRTHASGGDAPVQAPVIFGFVIMKHIITIVTLDAADPCAVIHVPCQLHMAERNQHQWNALAILVTICWARDVVLDYIDDRPDLEPEVKVESSDPDA
ncbi:hypothetical protein E0Z10_g5704 [Xylaria hypoxylon]|uniref:Uncharacterized protein n=1 Tax=Xylaria hypoxylon TaxID=37992 RepID=A0A4Z0YFH1_9PEZI|nr:hypothetical protein E0Z10_g5704 [Xylaria hypoxylon]